MPQYLAFGFDTHVSLHHIFAVFDCTRRPSHSASPKNLYKACRQLFVFVCGRYSSGESCYICLKYCALTLRLTSKAPETYCMLLRLLIQQFPVMSLWPSRSCCLLFQKGGTGPPGGGYNFFTGCYIQLLLLHHYPVPAQLVLLLYHPLLRQLVVAALFAVHGQSGSAC